MIKFVHTADIHFGMENYGRIDAKTGIHSRLLDFQKALNFCVDFAIKQDVDFFLFAGDAYKTANPTPTHQRLMAECLLRLYQAKIPIVMIVGNHDNPLSFGKSNALEIFGQIPIEGFHVVSKPRTILLHTKNGPVQIVGIPWPTRNTISISQESVNLESSDITEYISKAVSKIIKTLAFELDSKIPAVLSAHLTVSSGIFSGSEKRAVYGNDPIFLPSDLAIEPFDYVGLGHLHRFQNLNPNGYPAIIYSGSIERVDFGERKEEKGFCFVTIKNKTDTQIEFIKTPTRPFFQIEVHLTDTLDEKEAQTDQIIKKVQEYNIQDAIIKILYFLPAGKKDRVNLAEISQACSSAWYIVGIIPIRSIENKERRISLKVDMDLEKLLESYFNNKPELSNIKKELIQKTLLLESEIFQRENNQT